MNSAAWEEVEKSMEEIRWGIIGCGGALERKSVSAFQCVANSKIAAVMS